MTGLARAVGSWGIATLVLAAPGAALARDGAPPAEGKPPLQEEVERVAEETREKREMEPQRVPEIFVTGRADARGVPQVPLDAVGSRDVIGPDILRSVPSADLNQLVHRLPAVSTRPYNGGEAAAPSFSARGLPDDGLTEYILVLIDGVPASPLPYGWTAPSFLPVSVEKVYAVDLIRGGHAVRYSPNTVGGVLNFITDPIPAERTGTVKASFGSFGYRSTMLNFGETTDRGYGYLLSFVDRSGDGFRDGGEFSQQDLSLKVRFQEKESEWVEAKLAYFRDIHRAPGGLTPARYDRDRFANARPENNFDGYRSVVDVVGHRDLGEGAWVEGFAYYSETARRLNAQRPHFGTPTSYLDWEDEARFAAVGARAGRTLQALGLEHELYGGVRVLVERQPSYAIDSRPAAGGPETRVTDSGFRAETYSLHLDDIVRPLENLVVTAGARVEWVPEAEGRSEVAGTSIDHDFLEVLPGVGASYALTDRWALYGNYHESFRAPQNWGFDFAGNPQDLDFEKGDNREIGTRVRGPAGFSGSLARWWTRFDDVGVFYSGFYENLGRIHSDGTDLVVDWDAGAVVERLDGLALYASWTHQDSTLKEGPNDGKDTPYAWKDKAVVGARYRTDGWTFGLGATHVGATYSDEANTDAENATGNIGRNRSVTFWDASVSRRIELAKNIETELAVGVTNLFDAERFVHSRGGFFGPGRVAYAPRQYFLSVALDLWF